MSAGPVSPATRHALPMITAGCTVGLDFFGRNRQFSRSRSADPPQRQFAEDRTVLTPRQEERMKPGQKPSESGARLVERIKQAISDCEVSTTEYNDIMKIANEDHHIDPQEEALLSQLQSLIANGTIKRVKG